MGYFQQQNPWLEMAQYGRGLGDVLGKYLLELPKMRADIAQQQALVPMQLNLQQAQTQEAQQRAALLGEQLKGYPQAQAAKQASEQQHGELYKQQGEYYKQKGQALTNPALKPPSLHNVSPGQTTGVLEGGAFVPKYTAPLINQPPPKALDPTLTAWFGHIMQGLRPYTEGLAEPDNIYSMLTNQLATANGLMPQRTNMPPVQPPIQAPVQVPTAINPQTGQRLQFLNGQWVPVQ